MTDHCASLLAAIRELAPAHDVGRVAEVSGGAVRVSGLGRSARVGARIVIRRHGLAPLEGEVVRLLPDSAFVLTGSLPDGVAVGDRAVLHPPPHLAPSGHWIGRIVDPYGNPLDGRPLLRGSFSGPVLASPPQAVARRKMGRRLETGLSVTNTVLPLARGQRIGLFAGSGVGKSRLLAHFSRKVESDVAVIALIGERGREVNEFITETLGPDGLRNAVVVAATSDQSALTRRRCAWSAMAIAEHFRDSGKQVLLLADSVTRFAEAHREIAAAAGEEMAVRGHPASLVPAISGLCERAGPGRKDTADGDITAIFTVLVAGSDLEEPVADILRGVLDGHVVLEREIAERGRYPAIDVLKSVSRSLPAVASDRENTLIAQVRRLIGAYENSEVMIRAGLYAEGADEMLDQAVRAWPDLDGFLARAGDDRVEDCFQRLSVILRRAGALPPSTGSATA